MMGFPDRYQIPLQTLSHAGHTVGMSNTAGWTALLFEKRGSYEP